jgi:hypothetical protein
MKTPLDDTPTLDVRLEQWLAFLRGNFPELYVSTVIYFETYEEDPDVLHGTRVPE